MDNNTDNTLQNKQIKKTIIVAFAISIAALIIFLIVNNKETRITNTGESEKVSALVCTSHTDNSAFFIPNTANTREHEIKVMYKGENINKISYVFRGEYDSEDKASHDDASMHAKYNIYMGDHDIPAVTLTPTFIVYDNKFTINLFLNDYKDISPVISGLFYINSEDINTISDYSIEEMKKYYEKMDFSCKISD